MLTGAPYFVTSHPMVSIDDLWNYIDGKLAKGWMVTAMSPAAFSGYWNLNEENEWEWIDYGIPENNIPENHAYTILKTVQLSDGTKLVRVRNPWASNEQYNGGWSDDSDRWTEQFKQEAGYVKADDGMWFIDARNYHESFY